MIENELQSLDIVPVMRIATKVFLSFGIVILMSFFRVSGAASCNYHIVSAESRKYFQNAIPMSGSIENYWAMSPHKDPLEQAFQIARDLGKPQHSYEDLVAFLKAESADTLNRFSTIGFQKNALLHVEFGPVVESMYSM